MADHLSDATLLERFVIGHEEAAFAALVRRHGAVVRACCRRILQSEHHAEAARRLGLPAGSMSRRLGRARALLRQRLSGRGLPVAVVVLLGILLGFLEWGRGARTSHGMVAVR